MTRYSPAIVTKLLGYDTRGRRTSVADQNGKVTTYAYDDADRLLSVTDAQMPTHGVTQYAYDGENNLTSITDALNRTTSFAYDKFRRLTQTTFPSTLAESYTYDGNNNLLTRTDRNGNTITYVYDNLNRMTTKQYPGGSGSVSYTYDLADRLTQAADSSGTYGFSYDNMGRLTGTSTQYAFLPGHTYTNSYSYDAASNRLSMTDPQSGITTYLLTDPNSNTFGFTYDALSRRTSLTRPNGVNTSYSYDSLSHLLSILHQVNGATIDGATYTYDNDGNRLSKLNWLNGVTENYTYDPIYQLTQVQQIVSGTPSVSESYSYDLVGNRLSALNVASYSYNSSNELTSSADGYSYTYDNNGNTLTKSIGGSTTSYAWDFDNRLTQVTLPGTGGSVTFAYDPFGKRIHKSSAAGTTGYLYDGANAIEESDATGMPVTKYTQSLGVDNPLAMQRSGNYFFESDAVGSITSLSDLSGTLPSNFGYGAFGNQISIGGSVLPTFRYTGRDLDLETNLYYYRARYYDSTPGRFISEDPLGFFGGQISFYDYVQNNPVNLVDGSGMGPEGVAIGGAVGMLVGARLGGLIGGTVGGILGGTGGTLVEPGGGTIAGGLGGAGLGEVVGANVGAVAGGTAGAYVGSQIQDFLHHFSWPFDKTKPADDNAGRCSDDPKCKKIKLDCIDMCSETTLPTNRSSQGFPFFNCVNKCMEAAGCLGK